MASDADILARMRRGDRRAFAELYGRYAGPLYRFVNRYVACPAESEDIVHDVFLVAVRKQGELREAAALRSWLYTIARHRALNAKRRRREETLPDEVRDPVDEWTRDEGAVVFVEQRVAALPPKLRNVYLLRAAGKSYADIAAHEDVPIGTVRSRIAHMIKRLRREVETWTKE